MSQTPKNLAQAKEVIKEKEQEFKHTEERYESVILFKDGSKIFLKSSVIDKEGEFYFVFSDLHPALLYHQSVVETLVSLAKINENDMEWAENLIERRTDNNKDMKKSRREEKIEQLRKELEKLDYEIFEKLETRLKLSTKIGELKTEGGSDVYDPEREKEVIENVVKSDYDLPEDFVREIMKSILTSMREISKQKNE